MGSNWQTTSLKELGVRLIDCDHKTPKAVECGIPYIGIPQMDNGRINFDANPRLISEDDFKHWTRKANPMYGDIILSRRCNSGETVYVPRKSKFALGQNLVLLRPEGERVHPEYLRWAVHGKEWWNEVAKYLNPGAIFESLKCADIPKFKIPEPPISAQIKIAEHLSAISEKIELNQKINQTLEQMAQALFKSWFVDFDPVFDNLLASVDFKLENLKSNLPDELKQKAQRRLAALNSLENATECKASLSALAHELQAQLSTKEAIQSAVQAAEIPVKANFNANPKILAQHANTHAHFPSEFEHNEQLGWIPKGWEVNDIDKVSSGIIDHRGKTPKKLGGDWSLSGFPAISAKNIKSGRLVREDTIRYVDTDMYNKWMKTPLQQGDIAMTSEAPLGELYYFADDSNYLLSQRLYGIRADKEKCSTSFLYYWLQSDFARADLDGRATGTTVVGIRQSELRKVLVLTPSIKVSNIFDSLARSYLLKMEKNEKSNSQLTKLRDTLLPKLISGELQIPDVITDEEVVD